MKNKLNIRNSLTLLALIFFVLVPGFGSAQSFLLTPTTLPDFGNICVTATSVQSFTITGTSLTAADVTVSSITGYTVSDSPSGPFTSLLTFTQPGGSFSATVYVNFTPTLVQSYNGNIVVSGGGVPSAVNYAVTGMGVNTAPAVSTTIPATLITSTTATCAA